MDHDEETGAVRASDADTAGGTGAERTGHGRTPGRSSAGDDVAGPNQDNDGFATGHEQKPDPPEEGLQPNFARGIADEDSVDTTDTGNFSEGHEELPDSPEKHVERRFSEGIEQLPRDE